MEQRNAVTAVDATLMFTAGGQLIVPDRAEHARVCAIVHERPELALVVMSIIRERGLMNREDILAVLANMQETHPAIQEGTL